MHWLQSTLVLLVFVIIGCAAAPPPDPVTGNTIVHSPSMCKDKSGKYFLFSGGVGLEIRTSTDRKAWTLIGKVWPNGAPWTDKYTKSSHGKIWAPDCTYVNGNFILYYAASTTGSLESAIFLAKSSTGLPGSWSNKGMITFTTNNSDYNVSTPLNYRQNYGNKWYLSFGSYHTGIKSMNINPSTGLPLSKSITPLAQRKGNVTAMEASCVFKANNFYYLFTSWNHDHCTPSICPEAPNGTLSTYQIRVGRSTSPTGGFVDKSGKSLLNSGGTLVMGSHDNIVGPGGQDIMQDDDGPIMVYYYHTNFSSGWPVVT
ncbi:glycoside hydrolase family 43 protein [Macrolepiota fuliginosa MF-IS2]|uniref:Arabinan endo-1,5-alpha-L-arabinosidase n=1 Tax=Macrolepiota fuliginosa MF-IS2 TaxID=1400762 RepID=A0A9P5XCN7_9AGAR|nr:glycoside hydrolase family 43 protein [Macrolepiota fuliginosa MF-IS2]